MSWSSRQQRLRNMFGRQEDLCFQVVVCHYPDESNERLDFESACKKHGIEYRECESIFENFEITHGDLFFGNGFVILERDGSCETFAPVTECVYTTAETQLIEQMLQGDDTEENNTFFDKVVSLYAPKIEQEFKCSFRGASKYADWGTGAFKFQFIIHPYTPQLCHPWDIGVLKPITIVDGHVIYPQHNGGNPKLLLT